MTIGGISSGSNPNVQKPTASTGGNVAQLEQQKKALQDEIKRIKQDGKLQPDAKKKKIDTLEKKMREIEEAIQKASADGTKDVQSQKPSATKKSETQEQPDQLRKNKLGDAGRLLSVYA